MTSVLALAATLLWQSDDRPRIKSELPNGLRILASREDQSGTAKATVVYFASRKGLADDAGTMSLRHFVEHIVVKGADKEIDKSLEQVGALLSASSTRQGLTVTVSGPAVQLPLMISRLGAAVSQFESSAAEVAREAEILRQEQFVLPEWWSLHSAGWKVGFGDEIDPFGRPDDFKVTKLEDLHGMYRQMITGVSSSVVVYGDIVPAIAVERCREAFGGLPKGEVSGLPRPAEQFTGSARAKGVGEARSVVVPGLRNGSTIAAIGAALVYADRLGGSVIYEPSVDAGIVTLWNPRPLSLAQIDDLVSSEGLTIQQEVRSAALSWVLGLTQSRENWAKHEALFLRDGDVINIPLVQIYARGLTDGEVELALSGFMSGKCIEVSGR